MPNGTFVTTGITAEDIDRACGSGTTENLQQEEIDALPWTQYGLFENGLLRQLIPLDDGTFEFGPYRATYTVVRDHVEILEVGASAPYSFHWTFDGTQLTVSDPADDSGDCIVRATFVSHPWVLFEPTTPETTEAT